MEFFGWKNSRCRNRLLMVEEIRRSPVEVDSEIPMIYKVLAPSQVVVWHLFHRQCQRKPLLKKTMLPALRFGGKKWDRDTCNLVSKLGL